MKRIGFIVVLTFVIILMVAVSNSPFGATPAAAEPCELATFESLNLPDTEITEAQMVPANTFWYYGLHPEFCRVAATLTPSDDSNIKVEVWMPITASWNGNYLGYGNGGAAGSIHTFLLTWGVASGFATAHTDMGTESTTWDWTFGQGHPEKVIDWGWRSTHLMTVAAKQFINAYYGEDPQYSFFAGCSTGGDQALTEAQRFPEDYDGILAGDPAHNRTPLHAVGYWIYQATHYTDESYFAASKVPFIAAEVRAGCDSVDGLLDGLIDDPRQCDFDLAELLCQGAEDDTCLTAPQVEALRKIYAGPSNPRTGEQIFPGLPFGSEDSNDGLAGTIGPPPSEPQPPMLGGLVHWALGEDFDARFFDWDEDMSTVNDQLAAILNAVDPDLSAFKARGGKLLIYTGWGDALIYPQDTVNYYEDVMDTMGGPEETRDFARLFMVPGMSHCYDGDCPNSLGGAFSPHAGDDAQHNALLALQQWVEQGVAPVQIIATQIGGTYPGRTRPLCSYPEVARYSGTGSINDAANFMCVPPVEVRIEPEVLNLGSKGKFTAFITVPEGYDVRDWGIRNVECEGASAVNGKVSRGGRTYIAKFNRQDLQNIPAGDAVTFKVKGVFPQNGNQAQFQGYDTVRVK